jgi:hypothetical protein
MITADDEKKIFYPHAAALEAAKDTLEENKVVVPVFFCCKEGAIVFGPIHLRDERHFGIDLPSIAFGAGYMARMSGADCVVFVLVTEGIKISSKKLLNEEDFDITMMPDTYPQSMRAKIIIAYSIEIPSGNERFGYLVYKGTGEPDDPYTIVENNPHPKGGKCIVRISENIMNGYMYGVKKSGG